MVEKVMMRTIVVFVEEFDYSSAMYGEGERLREAYTVGPWSYLEWAEDFAKNYAADAPEGVLRRCEVMNNYDAAGMLPRR